MRKHIKNYKILPNGKKRTKGCKMMYAIKTNDWHNRFYAKCGDLTFIEEQNKYFDDKVFKTKKLWKAKIMCWLINLACRLSGFKERCVVVKLLEQKGLTDNRKERK